MFSIYFLRFCLQALLNLEQVKIEFLGKILDSCHCCFCKTVNKQTICEPSSLWYIALVHDRIELVFVKKIATELKLGMTDDVCYAGLH